MLTTLARIHSPAFPPQSRLTRPVRLLASGFRFPVSFRPVSLGARPQIAVYRDSQFDRTRAFTRQVHAIHFKKHFRPFQRVDEPHQLQVVSGKTSLDFNWNYAGDLRFLLLVVCLLDPYPIVRRQLPQFIGQNGILSRKAVLVEIADLILGQHDLIGHAAERLHVAGFLGQFGPEFVDLYSPRIRRAHQRREQNRHGHDIGDQHGPNRNFQLAPRAAQIRHYFVLLSFELGTDLRPELRPESADGLGAESGVESEAVSGT